MDDYRQSKEQVVRYGLTVQKEIWGQINEHMESLFYEYLKSDDYFFGDRPSKFNFPPDERGYWEPPLGSGYNQPSPLAYPAQQVQIHEPIVISQPYEAIEQEHSDHLFEQDMVEEHHEQIALANGHFSESESSSGSEEEGSQQQPSLSTAENTRKDPNKLSQNNSSKIKTLVSKLLSRSKLKEYKKAITSAYNQFLKENAVANSQLVLVFTYLFFIENQASQQAYAEFEQAFMKYLIKKQNAALLKEDLIMRNGLIVKIKATMQLLQYLFRLRGQMWIDFAHVRIICQPLFTKRQANTVRRPLERAAMLQERMRGSGEGNIKTSNTSSCGCQVNLE